MSTLTTLQNMKVRHISATATLEEMERINPVLHNGQMVVITDTGDTKMGDGETAFKDLPYFNMRPSVYDPDGDGVVDKAKTVNGFTLEMNIGESIEIDQVSGLASKLESLESGGSGSGEADLSSLFDETGKIKLELLPQEVLDDVVGGYYNEEDQLFYTTKVDGVFSDPVTPEANYVLYIDHETDYQYKYTGVIFSKINHSDLVIGLVEGTAYCGAKGAQLEARVTALESEVIRNTDVLILDGRPSEWDDVEE